MYVLGSGRYQPGIVRLIACFKLLLGCQCATPSLLLPGSSATLWLVTRLHRCEASWPRGTITFHGSKRSRLWGPGKARQGFSSLPQATSPCSQGLSGVKQPCLSSPNLSSLSLSTRRSLRNSRLTANRCDSAGRVLPCNPSSMDAAGPDKVEGGMFEH
jgi:hypothetical protein